MTTLSANIYARGLAIGGCDIMESAWHFRYHDEKFVIKDPALSDERPARCLDIFSIPELRYQRVARIEELRQCAARQSNV